MSSSKQQQQQEPKPLPPRKKSELDVISERKQGLVKDFYEKVWLVKSKDESIEWPTSFKVLNEEDQKVWCYKLMMARKFVIDDATKMLMEILEFRKKFKTEDKPYFPAPIFIKKFPMDELVAYFQNGKPRPPTDENDKIAKHMKIAYCPHLHGTDKWGHPILWENYGKCDPTLLIARAKQLAAISETFTDVVTRFHVMQNETALRLIRYQNEVWAKKQLKEKDPNTGEERQPSVHGILVVVDLDGLSMAHLTGDVIASIGQMFKIDAATYPEFITKVLVINTNALIRVAMALVSPMLDKRVEEKISFFAAGEASEKALREWIHEEDIPEQKGGKCKCEGGCIFVPTKEEVKKAVKELGKEVLDAGLAECGVPIAAAEKITREYKINKANEEIIFEWNSDSGYTVEFSAHFYPDSDPKNVKELVAPEKVTGYKDTEVCSEPGKVVLTFSNEFSWMRSKYVTLRAFVVNKSDTEVEVEGGIAPEAHHVAIGAEKANNSEAKKEEEEKKE